MGKPQCLSVLTWVLPTPSPWCLTFGFVFFFKVMEKCLTLGAKKIFYIPADMSNPLEPEKVVQFAVQKLGKHLGISLASNIQTVLIPVGASCFNFPMFLAGRDAPDWGVWGLGVPAWV